jgi:hypothetical protein
LRLKESVLKNAIVIWNPGLSIDAGPGGDVANRAYPMQVKKLTNPGLQFALLDIS